MVLRLDNPQPPRNPAPLALPTTGPSVLKIKSVHHGANPTDRITAKKIPNNEYLCTVRDVEANE